jgi:hypothetical protein
MMKREQTAALAIDIPEAPSAGENVSASWLATAARVAEILIALIAVTISIQQFRQDRVQAGMASILFTREYLNGYVYLYDLVEREAVVENVRDLRKVGLPAIAVPSQYSPDYWLVVSHTFGHFSSPEAAETAILHWRETLEKWEKTDKSKTSAFARHELHLRKDRGYKSDLVFFYKADIITHGRYFRRLARSDDLLVDP